MTSVAAPGKGVRRLRLKDQAPDCRIEINRVPYDLKETVEGRRVLDIGCGFGWNRATVESAGGTWTGIEPFVGGAHSVAAKAEELPFCSGAFDVVILDAVLEHIPDVGRAFTEVARVLKPGGVMIGYSAFMECFHEISYSHLSFKALERYAAVNGMRLEAIGGGSAFGIDYHLATLFYPIPFGMARRIIAAMIRRLIWIKSRVARTGLRHVRGLPAAEAESLADLYYKVECLRQSNGFSFIIRRDV